MKLIISCFLCFFIAFYSYSGVNNKEQVNIKYLLKCPKSPLGLIVLFPKFNNTLKSTDIQTNIDEKYYSENYATIIIDYKKDFFLKKKDFLQIYNLIEKVLKSNKINEDKVIIGGFSTGGTIALSYSIYASKLKKRIKPNSIIVGDSPVDFEAFYNNKIEIIKRDFNYRAVSEARFIVNYLKKQLGSPKVGNSNYISYSPYLNSNLLNSNIRYLKDYNIIFYSEPDLAWYKTNIGYELEDLNSFQIDKLIKELKRISQKKITHIKTSKAGFINNKRHPHSWSIINPEKLFKWTEENFTN
ncbi:hypothetical protein DS884_17210 [Tenacibaculum sp. E3R01]|uniref:hypothetical protein n=1 Tax=Tenacibaculum sp. E3R01 TaxID=2267227 RepID=UPI000DE8BB6E|nr:hypothetical protein [Tenacibaculum sp. E3R01]RBW54688.1 hypothetical protein DS884_17210 [Tenacibaculum sp. E3R01]